MRERDTHTYRLYLRRDRIRSGAHGASPTLACTPGAERTTPKAMQQFHLQFVWLWVGGWWVVIRVIGWPKQTPSVEMCVWVCVCVFECGAIPTPTQRQQLLMVYRRYIFIRMLIAFTTQLRVLLHHFRHTSCSGEPRESRQDYCCARRLNRMFPRRSKTSRLAKPHDTHRTKRERGEEAAPKDQKPRRCTACSPRCLHI